MLTKPRNTELHDLLNLLSKRIKLPSEIQTTHKRLRTGYAGEKTFFDNLGENITSQAIRLFDLHFKVDNSECQIDSLIIFQNKLLLFEIKNYQGNYVIHNHDWYTLSNLKMRNPLHQVQRTELLLNEFLKQHQISLNVEAYLVFVHPSFFLYQAPVNNQIIFPSQLSPFLKKLNNHPTHLTKRHHDLVRLFHEKQLATSMYESIPVFEYEDLEKGIVCKKCQHFMKRETQVLLSCRGCEYVSDINSAIIRSVDEYHLLFPKKRITVSDMSHWMNGEVSPYQIRQALISHCIKKGHSNGTYYTIKEQIKK